jgi:hypothetical protein
MLVILENLVYTLAATVPDKISLKLVRMVVMMYSRSSKDMGHLCSETRSHSPYMEKPCLHLKGYCYDPNNLKIGQKGCFGDC